MNLKSFRGFRTTYEIQGNPDDSYFKTLPDHDLGGLANYLYRLVSFKDIHISLDIGANIGLSTLLIAEICPGSKVIGFEPTPTAYEHMKENVSRASGWKQISLQPLAVGKTVGTVKFATSDTASAQNHVSQSNDGIDAKMTSIDAFSEFHMLPFVDFIKIDIEGYEMFAIEGAHKTLLKHRPTLFFEFNERAIVHHLKMDPEEYLARIMTMTGLLAVVDPSNGDTVPLPVGAKNALASLRMKMRTAEDVFDLVNQGLL
jgi:FkbM family methyltransferase